ncbi:CoA-transferase family III [Plectosphaerella plurivora]|uniref:CoA-transferase family III n=1 Tax=Plectosphaerella plurivora TaxID=936078 RepID=A0A9P8VLN6_9PEZI|nr:CoA-transferase family III [Plectosphaerella plurivora]
MVVVSLGSHERTLPNQYSVKSGAESALATLLTVCGDEIPQEFTDRVHHVAFNAHAGDQIFFPCPLKEQEAVASIKALEGLAAAAIADLRQGPRTRSIEIDMAKVACFLMSAYLCTIDGMDKAHPRVKDKITDLYRRLSANLYETRTPGEFYHIHGSLEASKTLRMIGLPAFDPKMRDYKTCIATIEAAVKRFTVAELEDMNSREGQAGIPVLKSEQFRQSKHGQALLSLPPFTVQSLEAATPPTPFGQQDAHVDAGLTSGHCLRSVRVVELCRVIAGPAIGRSLAAHGAQVIKVTSPELPDVPFFQVDVNTGKHTTSLNLRKPEDRQVLDLLLASADVFIDGYRPGSLDRLGYGSQHLKKLALARGKGFVYVAEDCFGGTGTDVARDAEWSARPGWQQIADCATGVAWEQGRFMGLNEPVVPPFPMSDYGTGALGCLSAMVGLYRRATLGGSWECRTSLCQYNLFLLELGSHAPDIQSRLRKLHDPAFFELRHHDSVDEVGRQALRSIRSLHPVLFSEDMMQTAWSEAFQAEVRWPREALTVDGATVRHVRATRPNGYDAATWDHWEEQDDMIWEE